MNEDEQKLREELLKQMRRRAFGGDRRSTESVEEQIMRVLREQASRADAVPNVDPNTGEPDPWGTFDFFNTPVDKKPKPESEPKETWQEHSRRLLKDWEPHYNEKSSEKFFINLINLMCKKLRERGLYVRLEKHNNQKAMLIVSHDHPGAKEQKFFLKNEDGINFSWHRTVNSWRDF